MAEARELKALLVDDEQGIIRLLTRVLNGNGVATIDVAATTQEGLKLLEGEHYNLVFTDLNQQPSGVEVYRAAKAKGSEAYIMSGYAPDMNQAVEIAKDHFLGKPFNIPLINRIIREYIAKQNP